MRHAPILALSLLLALAAGSAQAQWRWRDASGRVTASDLPPPATVPERDILVRPSDSRRAAPAANNNAASAAIGTKAVGKDSIDPELEARRKRAVAEQATAQRQLEERNATAQAENCSRARAHLNVINDGKRIAHTNAKGEVEVMDDKGRAEEAQRARAIIASDCK
jgi:hypothetical protein